MLPSIVNNNEYISKSSNTPSSVNDAKLSDAPLKDTEAKTQRAWKIKENIAKTIVKIAIIGAFIAVIVGTGVIIGIPGGIIPGVICLALSVGLIGIAILCSKLADKARSHQVGYDTNMAQSIEKTNNVLTQENVAAKETNPTERKNQEGDKRHQQKLTVLDAQSKSLDLQYELTETILKLKLRILKNDNLNSKEQIAIEINKLDQLYERIVESTTEQQALLEAYKNSYRNMPIHLGERDDMLYKKPTELKPQLKMNLDSLKELFNKNFK
jgi:hypothetical protein